MLTQKIGDSKTHTVPLTWAEASFSPSADWAFVFTAKRSAAHPDSQAVFQKASGAGVTVTGSNAAIAVLPADSASLTADVSLVCDLQGQNAVTGEIRTVWADVLKFKRDVTRLTQTSVPVHTTELPVPFAADSAAIAAALGYAPADAAHSHDLLDSAASDATPNTLVMRNAEGGASFGENTTFASGSGNAGSFYSIYGNAGRFEADAGNGGSFYSGSGNAGYFISNSGTGGIFISGDGPYHAEFGALYDDRSFVARLLGAFGWWRGAYTLMVSAVDTLTANRVQRYQDKDGTIALTDDAPTAHKSSHATGGSDALTPSDIGAASAEALTTKADLVGGVIPTSQIPALAVTSFLGTVASEAAMLLLDGQSGDWCNRSDVSMAYVLTGSPSSDIANWQAINYPAAPVLSVNGQAGTVVLAASDVGAATAAQGAKADTAFITAASEKTTPADADQFGITDSAAGGALKRLSFANLWARIKGLIEGTALTFTTRPAGPASGVPAANDLLTRTDSDRRVLKHLRSVVYSFDSGWTATVTTGGSVNQLQGALRLDGANGTAAGAATASLAGIRSGIGVNPQTNFSGIDFANPVNINFAFRTRNFAIASSLNWAAIFGQLETTAAGIANMVKTGANASIGWVGLRCLAGNVRIVAVNGTSAVAESGVIDTCVDGYNSKAYRLEVAGGTVNCYSGAGVLLGSLSSNVPTTTKEYGPAILVESSATTNQIGIIVQHLSLDW